MDNITKKIHKDPNGLTYYKCRLGWATTSQPGLEDGTLSLKDLITDSQNLQATNQDYIDWGIFK